MIRGKVYLGLKNNTERRARERKRREADRIEKTARYERQRWKNKFNIKQDNVEKRKVRIKGDEKVRKREESNKDKEPDKE